MLDRFYKGFLTFLSIGIQLFGQKSQFPIGFTIESAMTGFIHFTQITVFLWFYKGFLIILSVWRWLFRHESSFSIGFTIESAVSFELIFWSLWVNFWQFWDFGANFGPDFLQRPSLRVWHAQPKGKNHQIELPSSGPDLGIPLSPKGRKYFFRLDEKKVSHVKKCFAEPCANEWFQVTFCY